MYRLTNISDDPWTIERFGNEKASIVSFLDRNGLDGLELIRWGGGEQAIPFERVIGKHLSFWPMWLDFWRGNEKELLRQFGDRETIKWFFRADTPQEFVENYRRELEDAAALGVKYVVFHVSHVELEHSYSYRFTYSDGEVVEAFLDLINRILDGAEYEFHVLMENHWFPGLTFLDGALARKLLDDVRAEKKGFVLDVGHLMNTNTALESEEEALEYMMGALGRLDEGVRSAIRAMHLNSSITGGYVRAATAGQHPAPSGSFQDRLIHAMGHVGRIDRHQPFLDSSIRRVVEFVRPDFLVYELSGGTLDELEGYIRSQNKALGY